MMRQNKAPYERTSTPISKTKTETFTSQNKESQASLYTINSDRTIHNGDGLNLGNVTTTRKKSARGGII
ncbi:hypothetical protein TUM22923_09240 [Polynucleobacter sp. TUM22923]|nr:hypothetical protein TUM22923_09240 [Polynucleobacter sp. TUM22923]